MQRILVCGAGGFIGATLVARLRAAGHQVVAGRSRDFDYAQLTRPQDWPLHLNGIDAVVNAVGVLRDSRRRPMRAIHGDSPGALFKACAELGLRRVVQISALGVADGDTLYARSKRAADEVLLQERHGDRLDATVLRPSIVFGRRGASSQLFMNLARLPVLILPAAALRARVQPVSVHDLAEAVTALFALPHPPELLSAVGPQALTLADFIASLRQQLGHSPARVLPLPDAPSRWSARLGDHIPVQPWCSETLALLQRDNADDPAAFTALLGRPGVAPQELVSQAWAR